MATALQASPMQLRAPDTGFPKGWYAVAESAEVTGEAMLPVRYLGEDLIVYRTADGAAQVSGAYCPHLGAHLASHDGAIAAGRITCPFHKWQFDGATGRCVHIPYTDVMVPASVKLDLYPTREVDGMVLMWYHPAGAAPDHEPFTRAGETGVPWTYYTTHEWISTCPYRDLFENLFDTAHVQQLHNAVNLPVIEAIERKPYGLQCRFVPPKGEQYEITRFENNFTGVSMVTAITEGPGFGFLQCVTATPIDNERFRQVSRYFVRDMGSEEANAALGKPFADNTAYETEKDFRVLNYKKHLTTPRLCAGDGPIMKWRQYQEEFYV